MPDAERFDAEAALRPLKKFQRRTVDYVMRRFYQDSDATMRFLVADEVGLGKTMVARGVIACAIERLWDSVERIDVLYICSNQAIAGQNIKRLNVLGKEEFELPTRMTLLPLQLAGEHGLGRNKVNFISRTPGTTFNLRSAAAVAAVARFADAPEVVEYWKSAPYLLNFMRDYSLKRAIRAYDGKECPAPLLDAIAAARPSSLIRRRIREYRPLNPPNGRMRLLMDDVFGDDLDQHLWIPPSLPYYRFFRPRSKSTIRASDPAGSESAGSRCEAASPCGSPTIATKRDRQPV